MKYFSTLLALFSLAAIADMDKAPQAFPSEHGKAVFVDFERSMHYLVYDASTEKAKVSSTIVFNQNEEGFPIFDLVEEPTLATIDGEPVEVALVKDPDGQTKLRLVKKNLTPGEHILVVENRIKANTEFTLGKVASGFWMSDLSDRQYVEQYIPSNLEYDRYKISFDVKVLNSNHEHEIFTNGNSAKIGSNHFAVVFPEYFTASSVYFHLTEKNRFEKRHFDFTSKNGARIPIVAYTRWSWNLSNIESKVREILAELEQKFGAWGHPSLTIYLAGSGGMEHSGATITSLRALGHELTHSYFARGVMPINGSSGWIDEAIASWRDDGYPSREKPFYSSAQMAGYSQYRRYTDRKAYTEGASFMAYLNDKLSVHGGLSSFLSNLYDNYLHQSISTQIFERELNAFSGINFSEDFGRYIYGLNEEVSAKSRFGHKHHMQDKENPYHPKLTKQQLLDLL